MKKLLIILITFLMSGICFAQFTKPSGVTPITGYTFFYNPADSTMTVCWGNPQKCNTFVQHFDTTKLAGWVNNRKLLSYKQIKDTLSKSGYATNYRLLHKIDSIMGLVKYRNDSIANSGYFTNYKALSKEDKITAYEQTITNGVAVYTVPFILKSTAMVIYNYQILRNTLWTGVGTNTLTLYIDPRTYDYLKIQN